MAYVLTDESNYEDIADAIREKNGTSDTYTPSEMARAIRGIETGGDVTGVKGNAESSYRTGDVNITPGNVGAKPLQTAVASPSASGTSIEFIDSISQDAQGVITPTKKTVREATTSQSGLMSGTDKSRLDSIRSSVLKELKYYLDLPYPIKTGTHAKMEEYPDPNIGCAKIDILTAEDNTLDKWLFGHTPYYAYVANTRMELDDLDARATAAEAQRLAMYPTDTADGDVVVISDGAGGVPVKALVVDIDTQTGVTGATITRCGKNLCHLYSYHYTGDNIDVVYTNDGVTINGTPGSDFSVPTSGNVPQDGLVTLPPGTYRPSVTASGVGVEIVSYNPAAVLSSGEAFSLAAQTTVFARLHFHAGVTYDNLAVHIQLERGTAATDYEPYACKTYTVDWAGTVGAITSGTLDVVNGVLTTGGLPYGVTPVEVMTMQGANTIWADCGNVTVTYRADPTLQHDNLDGGDVGFSLTAQYPSNTVGAILREVYDNLFEAIQEIGKLVVAIDSTKMLVYNEDGTVTWEDAPS